MVNVKDKAIAAAGLSVIIFSAVLASYHDAWGDFYEMTFLSNTLASIVLMAGAVKLFATGRDIPQVLYLDAAALLAVVVGICSLYAPRECLGGAGITLHLINPLLMFSFFAVFCDAREIKIAHAFTALIFPSLYYIFMIVYGRVTGGYVYVYFDPNLYGARDLILYAVVAIAAVSVIAVGMVVANGALRTRYEDRYVSRRAPNRTSQI